MIKWIGGVLVLAGAVWIWQQIGYLWIEQTDCDHRRDIFAPTVPKYRQTQARDDKKLRIQRTRIVLRKRA
jgi:hypothetical protein